jgi:hypothetical protein
MCTHIHRNHTAFVESIKNNICLTTLQEHKDNVSLFLRSIQDNLRLISSTGDEDSSHNDLLPHIFLQLCAMENTHLSAGSAMLAPLVHGRKNEDHSSQISPDGR